MFSQYNQSKFLHSNLHENHSQELLDAPDKPPTKFVTVVVIISFLLVFILIALSFPVIEKLSQKQEDQVDTGMGNKERIVYILNQKQIMESYKKIDDSHYQIPVTQAMKIIVATQGDISKIQDSAK